jgi:hypothetical protein
MTTILGTDMTLRIEAKHDLTPNEIGAIEDRLYDHDRCPLYPQLADIDRGAISFAMRVAVSARPANRLPRVSNFAERRPT